MAVISSTNKKVEKMPEFKTKTKKTVLAERKEIKILTFKNWQVALDEYIFRR